MNRRLRTRPPTCGRISATWLALRRPGSSSSKGASCAVTVTTPTSTGAARAAGGCRLVLAGGEQRCRQQQCGQGELAMTSGEGMTHARHRASTMWRELEAPAWPRLCGASRAGAPHDRVHPCCLPQARHEAEPRHPPVCRRVEHGGGGGRGDGRGRACQPQPRLPRLPERAGGEPARTGRARRHGGLPPARQLGLPAPAPRTLVPAAATAARGRPGAPGRASARVTDTAGRADRRVAPLHAAGRRAPAHRRLRDPGRRRRRTRHRGRRPDRRLAGADALRIGQLRRREALRRRAGAHRLAGGRWCLAAGRGGGLLGLAPAAAAGAPGGRSHAPAGGGPLRHARARTRRQ